MYDQARFMTVTGSHVTGTPTTIEPGQNQLDDFYAKTFPEKATFTSAVKVPDSGNMPAQLTDAAILDAARKARNGPAITALLAGDASGYGSASEADLALISLLSFYTQDSVQLDRLFRGSGLAREKWERQDYRDATIAKALDSIGETYGPAPQVRHAVAQTGPQGDSEAATGLAAIIEPATVWAERAGEVPLTIIEGILAAGALAFMASEPKVGKTWLAVALMLSIANDRPFMGVYPVNTPGRVLYIVSEGSHGGTVARFHSLARGLGLDPAASLARIDIVWRRGVRLDDAALVAELDQLTQEREYILIVGDVMADLHEGDENSATEMSAFLRPLKDVASHGPTVLLLTHTAKQNESTTGRRRGQRIRGSSTQHASLDSGIYLSRSEAATRTTVSFESRDDVEAAPFTFAWPLGKVDGSQVVTLDHQLSEAGLTDLQGQQSQALKMIREEPGISRGMIRERLAGRNSNRSAAIDGLIESGLVRPQIGVEYQRKDGTTARHEGLFIASKTDPNDSLPVAGNEGNETQTMAPLPLKGGNGSRMVTRPR
jgi:hypothetical protein